MTFYWDNDSPHHLMPVNDFGIRWATWTWFLQLPGPVLTLEHGRHRLSTRSWLDGDTVMSLPGRASRIS
ncbi:MAG: hypothetical protein MZV63_68265 [Marinilabiliales bacterium]|nr:hypothetical protein [Marinilabiliales bacterium]